MMLTDNVTRDPPPPARVLAIGDVHGCARALDALLAAVAPTADDTIVTLGDYVDRGLDSAGVIDRLIALSRTHRLIPLRGNTKNSCSTPDARATTWNTGCASAVRPR